MAKGFGRAGGAHEFPNAVQREWIGIIERHSSREEHDDRLTMLFAQRGPWDWERFREFLAKVNASRHASHLGPMNLPSDFPKSVADIERVIAWKASNRVASN